MSKDKIPTEYQQSLPLHRILEDEYITLHGPLPNGYPWSFLHADIKDPVKLFNDFTFGQSQLSQHLKKEFRAFLVPHLNDPDNGVAVSQLMRYLDRQVLSLNSSGKKYLDESGMLTDFLNLQLIDEDFYNEERFAEVELKPETEEMARSHQQGKKLSQINRRLLEEAYPEQLRVKLCDYNFDAVAGDAHAGAEANGKQGPNNGKPNYYQDVHVSTIYSIIHEKHKRLSAICFSGGGIRSATFNLGILQGLARHKLIEKFDYLSTVSGGGYIGSWLSAWAHRHPEAIAGVTQELRHRPDSPLRPEPKEVTHLRTYSNYLSPQIGLLSADTWTLIVIYLRNLFLNWMVFIPLLLAVLMIPRMGVAAVFHSNTNWDWLEPVTLFTGAGLALIGIFYAGYYLPRADNRRSSQTGFLLYCLSPLILSCVLLTYFWSLYQDGTRWAGWDYIARQLPYWLHLSLTQKFMFCVTFLIFLGWLLYVSTRWSIVSKYVEDSRVQGKDVRLRVGLTLIGSVLVIIATGSLTGYLVWWIATTAPFSTASEYFPYARLYACFAAPLLLAVISLGTNVFVGFASRGITDEDLEWLARFAAWILITIVVWVTMNALVLYGPNLLLSPFRSDATWRSSVWSTLGTIAGVISGIITIIGGFSAKTPASNAEQNQSMIQRTFRYQLPRLAAPAFMFFLIIVLSTLTNWLLTHFSHWMQDLWPRLPLRYYLNLPVSELSELRPPMWLDHDWMVKHSRFDFLLLTTTVMATIGFVMGRFIDTSKFSMHSLYGNRLERAYLAASNSERNANWFTDFDPGDDLQMHELRPALFDADSFKNVESLIEKLRNGHDHLSREIYEKLSPSTRQLIESSVSANSVSKKLRACLASDLNNMLDIECLYVDDYRQKSLLEQQDDLSKLLRQTHQGESLVVLNRWLLEEAFADEIKPRRQPRPLHVVNMALNLMRGNNLAWQERKAETFTVSPLHSGNHLLGYRRTRYYGGDNGISLGTAFTISGAAASPNMGYMIASPLVSFLMAMFNVRLGWWLGNPGDAGQQTFNLSVPRFAVGPIFSEALSMTDDKSPYVYLSDGGHFDNLGLYEMVLRRCRFIVVCDGSTDPHYKFDALGMAIRKIRIDLGVPIEFRAGEFELHTRPPETKGKYCAIATIRYSCVDRNKPDDDGLLIYIKASLSGDEPQDVRHYQQENDSFPQEFIGDQFFSESQFESYRMLGSHIIDALCGDGHDRISLDEMERRVREYHKRPAAPPNPQA